MSVVLMERDEWIEEWLRTHPEATYADAVFEFEDFAAECRVEGGKK